MRFKWIHWLVDSNAIERGTHICVPVCASQCARRQRTIATAGGKDQGNGGLRLRSALHQVLTTCVSVIIKVGCVCVLTFGRFTVDHTEPAVVLLAFARLHHEAALDDRAKYARLVRSEPFGFAQLLHGHRAAELLEVIVVVVAVAVVAVVDEMIAGRPQFDLADDAVAARLLFHAADVSFAGVVC